MWMVDSNDHGKELKMPTDPVYGRKLRPLMPRPFSSCTAKNSPFSTISTPCCCCIRSPNIHVLPWNHPISDNYGVKREIQTVPLVSTRWNPTPEQVQALEEMYRRGIRTPSAEQIQQIAAKLRRFGKIEGKNVFYWFQNHKARERQKKRRQLELLAGKKMHHAETLETKQTGLSGRYFEIEHNKKLPTPALNCSTTPLKDSASMRGAVIAPEYCRKDGWTQLHHKELQEQQQKILTAKNETCWQFDSSSCLSPNSNISSINAITPHKATGQENTSPSHSLNLTIALPPKNDDGNLDENHEMKENQTLQLFPIGNISLTTLSATREEEIGDASIVETKFTPSEFIEFLPTKN